MSLWFQGEAYPKGLNHNGLLCINSFGVALVLEESSCFWALGVQLYKELYGFLLTA
jgi:hypothetical protein